MAGSAAGRDDAWAGMATFNWTTAATAAAPPHSTATTAPCGCCGGCTPRARRCATTCWCTRPAASSAATCWKQLELPGVWLERCRIDGSDRALLDSPLGLAGHTVMATMWLADGGPLGRERTELLIDVARALIDASPLATTAGITAAHESLLVLRVLAHRVEPAMALLQAVWKAWRPLHWGLAVCAPRLWRT